MSKEKLIIALDVHSAAEAREIVSEIGDLAGAFKIGLQLFTASGPSFVREIVDAGHRVFLDLKFHDIPNTVARAGVEAARLGVWMFNVHASGGSEMMKRTVDEVEAACIRENLNRPLIIGVTVLTSSDESSLIETGVRAELGVQVLNLARLAAKYGLDGVVASARECKSIRAAGHGDGFLIVTPGIRLIDATNDDQKRVTTPAAAINAGTDYLVVGRPIIEAANMRSAAAGVIDSFDAGL